MARKKTQRVGFSDRFRSLVLEATETTPVYKIAAKAGVPQSSLSRWLSDDRAGLNLANVAKLCDYLQLTLTK